MSQDLPTIVVVDDEYETNGIGDAIELSVDPGYPGSRWPGRPFRLFSSIRDALELLTWDERFVLILDHNLEAGIDPDLAELLEVSPHTDLKGYHFCSALRRKHLFGLAIPVAYYTGWMSNTAFVELLEKEGPFLPNYWVDKTAGGENRLKPTDIVERLDELAAVSLENFLIAAARAFSATIPVSGGTESFELEF